MSPKTAVPIAHRPATQPDMARLVRAAAGGSDAAWQEIVARFGGLVWSVARSHRLSHADAGDAVQCTWLRLVQHLDAVKNPEALGAWLATTARRECLRIIAGAKCEVGFGDDLPEPPPDDASIDDELLRDERDELLWKAVSLLRPEDQALLRMLASDPPASYLEISAALDMPIGSIGPTRARCLERLRARCEQVALSPV